ncbi:MAG: hypothetical protein K0S98_3076, partial [Propionibacteriaceae bacterium]|nr:hypothetical protein [Propionibacteriaceae bacterium]
MWIMTPTTRGAEQEVKVSPFMPPFIDPSRFPERSSVRAMRYATTCH